MAGIGRLQRRSCLPDTTVKNAPFLFSSRGFISVLLKGEKTGGSNAGGLAIQSFRQKLCRAPNVLPNKNSLADGAANFSLSLFSLSFPQCQQTQLISSLANVCFYYLSVGAVSQQAVKLKLRPTTEVSKCSPKFSKTHVSVAQWQDDKRRPGGRLVESNQFGWLGSSYDPRSLFRLLG